MRHLGQRPKWLRFTLQSGHRHVLHDLFVDVPVAGFIVPMGIDLGISSAANLSSSLNRGSVQQAMAPHCGS
jgi:hypothetical protein